MRTVKTRAELEVLQGKKPEVAPSAPAPAPVQEAQAPDMQPTIDAIKAVETAIRGMSQAPVEVKVGEPAKVRKWKFTCEYDRNDVLTSITAEAQD